MLQMAFEREVIMSIRYQVDAQDEQCLFGDKSSALDTDANIIHSHVRLGSLDGVIHLSSYAKKLEKDIHLQGLQDILIKFLHLNCVLNMECDASAFQVRANYQSILSVLTLIQVVPCHALRVTYDCQETAVKKMDILHVTPSWRGSGARYDCAILQGQGTRGLIFCQVCAIFMILIGCEWHRLAIVRIYKQKRRNKITGHIELVAPKDGHFDLCFINSLVRIAHILPPASHNVYSIVQDLYDGDMYLRLHSIQ
jgi:hypothetical protein